MLLVLFDNQTRQRAAVRGNQPENVHVVGKVVQVDLHRPRRSQVAVCDSGEGLAREREGMQIRDSQKVDSLSLHHQRQDLCFFSKWQSHFYLRRPGNEKILNVWEQQITQTEKIVKPPRHCMKITETESVSFLEIVHIVKIGIGLKFGVKQSVALLPRFGLFQVSSVFTL